MKPYVLLGLAVAWFASVGGAFWYGTGVGADGEIAKQASIKTAVEQTRKAAQEGAADAISRIKITNTTVRAATETIVREHVVYRDCRHPPEQLRNLNDALTGRTQPPGDSKLPGVNAVN